MIGEILNLRVTNTGSNQQSNACRQVLGLQHISSYKLCYPILTYTGIRTFTSITLETSQKAGRKYLEEVAFVFGYLNCMIDIPS
jgi:hypothetical protein